MNQHALAPIKWEVGQPLLPSHLTAQEDFLLADSALRTQAQGLPQYGLSQLLWDEPLLKKGNLSITHFRLVLPSGNRVVDYPDNTHLLSPQIELGELESPTVYYFILEENIHKQEEAQPRVASNGSISRRHFKLVISPIQQLPEAFDYLLNDHVIQYQGCLGVFKHHSVEGWQITDDFIPPLINIGTSAFLLSTLTHIKAQLKHYKESLHTSFASSPLPVKQYVSLNDCVKSVQTSLFMLENLINLDNKKGELKLHPYQVYKQLYQLYVELSLYQGDWPSDDIVPYKHEEIHYVFKQLLIRLHPYLTRSNTNGRSSQFHLNANIYSAEVPNGTSRSDELYFIVKLSDMPDLNTYEVPQISCPTQLSRLFEYSLKGLSLKEVSDTTINYNFGENVQCFRIEKDKESDAVHAESAAAFYNQHIYNSYDFYLYTQNHQH